MKICSICNKEGSKDSLRFKPYSRKCLSCENKKKCYICNKIKLIDEFPKDSSRGDGLNNKCKICCNEKEKIRTRKRYTTEKDKEKRRIYEKNRKRTPSRRMRELFKDILKKLNKVKESSMWKTLGYTRDEFRLKFPIIPKNHDIDHMIPISWFEDSTPLRISCALPNLQILESSVNNSKRNFYCDKPSDNQFIIECLPFIKNKYLDIVKNLL